jgi:hypothetical protein
VDGTWIARHPQRTIAYLKEENGVLLERLGGRIRLNDRERRRLARVGHELGSGSTSTVADRQHDVGVGMAGLGHSHGDLRVYSRGIMAGTVGLLAHDLVKMAAINRRQSI